MLSYSREFLVAKLKALTEEPPEHIPSDLSNLVSQNYAASVQSGDDSHSAATSASDSSLSPVSTAPDRPTFEWGESDDELSLTDRSTPTSIRGSPRRPPPLVINSEEGQEIHTDSDATPQGMRFLPDDDSDLEERLLMVAAGQSPPSPASSNRPRKTSFQKPSYDLEFSRSTTLQGPKPSLLSAALNSATDSDPLSQFIIAAGTADSNLTINVYFAFGSSPSIPSHLRVRADAPVHHIIGFALYNYSKSNALEDINPNHYNMRLVEEDGEPDDDFPALERKRQFDSYQVDEVVLVMATIPEQVANQQETPFEIKSTSQKDDGSEVSDISVRVYMFPFDHILSHIYWTDVRPSNTPSSHILEQVCKAKQLPVSNYVIRAVNSRVILDHTSTLGALNPQQMAFIDSLNTTQDEPGLVLLLELVPRRAIENDESFRSPSKRKNTQGSIPSSFAPAPMPALPGLTFQKFGYYKYRVWRRQQMSFLGRHERELAIDGEYVYIMPPTDRSLLEQPKTTTFHIRQVIRCKQSSKIDTYLKIFVMKQTGPKRYDIDCISASDCFEIVERINRLMKSF